MKFELIAAPLVLTAAIFGAGPASAAGDAAKGAVIFKRCAICHTVDAGKKSVVGPNLAGVVGRKAGSTDFAYSSAMKTAGFTWTKEKLDTFIKAPAATVKGNRMAFSGVPNDADRADLIAFLASKK